MLHEQFQRQNFANSIDNERFGVRKHANTLETAASSSKKNTNSTKMLQNHFGQWKVPTPKCCKDIRYGSFQLQNAANSKEYGQKHRSKQKAQKRKNIISKTNPDLLLLG